MFNSAAQEKQKFISDINALFLEICLDKVELEHHLSEMADDHGRKFEEKTLEWLLENYQVL